MAMELDPSSLKDQARAQTGLADFGEAPMDEGLEVLCRSLSEEAGLDEKRGAAAEARIVGVLKERLKVEDWLRRHPEILESPTPAPIMVFGLPRTGSTALSQFLSEDPKARTIRRWECMNATPPPDASTGVDDPRLAATRAAFEELDRQMPARRSMLPVSAEDASEHGPIQEMTFQNLQTPSLYHIPSYRRWAVASDKRPSFEYLKKVLQLLQSKTPASHWNLKNPPDLFSVDDLLAVFPDARLVWTHRDPADSLASVASLTSMIRLAGGEPLDKRTVGPAQLDFQLEGVTRAMAVDDTLPPGRIAHFYQADLSRDAVGTIGRLYDQIGLEFTDAFRDHLVQRMANRPRGSHGAHSYTLEEFGLTLAAVREGMKSYVERYSIPLEM